mmetsp:Transcript_3902/g.4003  ORF Transcript_3902/g.4003 Transcript_3902/m.4003 type:complete len:349 (+) Transcript_3902:8-1054(+)
MKNQFYLTLFLAVMFLCFADVENTKLRAHSTKQNEDFIMSKIISPAKLEALDCTKYTEESEDEDEKENKKNSRTSFLRGGKADLWWVKPWGYESSAYLFDYLEQVIKPSFLADSEEIFTELFEAPDEDENYKDPFDYENYFSENMTEEEKNTIRANWALINPNYVKSIYEKSINAVQLNLKMKDWNWVRKSDSSNYAKNFVSKYDAMGQGRVNFRDTILGAIHHNKKNYMRQQIVDNVFPKTIKILNGIFTFLDCNNDTYISAEELLKNLPKLARKEPELYNIFTPKMKNTAARAINDFVLKSHGSMNGILNKKEFISGILYGFWNRQTERTGLLEDDSRTLAKLRWK